MVPILYVLWLFLKASRMLATLYLVYVAFTKYGLGDYIKKWGRKPTYAEAQTFMKESEDVDPKPEPLQWLVGGWGRILIWSFQVSLLFVMRSDQFLFHVAVLGTIINTAHSLIVFLGYRYFKKTVWLPFPISTIVSLLSQAAPLYLLLQLLTL